ncbi:single-stranded-DNA-specific exonuclease RecJ [Acetivibrio straminisolvens]|uniref:single-stranded-DNA-specific exonuclease RecJ n=1 Tax=Acetivibrio straminisolvens TaxID=253314 RepID=UPI00223ED851|nr:single-stranded-DNA-specific exonuclease RecJ [Acetivibrio straminisolvens]
MGQDRLWLMNDFSHEKVEILAEEAGVSKLLAGIFLSRGVDDPDYIKDFLNPSLDKLHDPFELRDMEKAVDRIIRALHNNEKILIYGDYDVDGITSTSILYDFLRRNNANVCYYIPDRLNEGYGISMATAQKMPAMDVDLIITVDCGITAFEEVKYITGNNIDIIITDHHECRESVPDAYAVVNPHRLDCTYPFKELAGVGVAYKLLEALAIKMNIPGSERRYLDIVALGTVADVVPLLGENRIIVKYGLSIMEKTSNIGLKSLIKVAGAENKEIDSFVIGFVLGPRINAAGRIGDATRAVRLLTTDDENEALEIAKELNEQNILRKQNELAIFEEAVNIVESDIDLGKEKVIVVAGEKWHHGVIGIVSSKITEKYYRPSILISVDGDEAKGSARSIEGFNLFKALVHCEEVLEKYGGHEQAAGLALKPENIDDFRRMINEYADSILDEGDLVPRMKIDVRITRQDMTVDNCRELKLLAPFGESNPSPVLRYDNLRVGEIRLVGQDSRHAKIRFDDNGAVIDAICFNGGRLTDYYSESDVVDVVCSMEVNSWNGRENVQLNIKDIRLGETVERQNKFYFSLDRCIDFIIRQEDNIVDEVLSKIQAIEYPGGIAEAINVFLSRGEKTAVLVNSPEGLEFIERDLKKALLSCGDTYGIFFSSLPHDSIKPVSVVVNPHPEEALLSNFDRVILFGAWISKYYIYQIVRKIDLKRVYVYNKIIIDFVDDDIILKRQDMVAVYKYLKSCSEESNQMVLEDLFALARNVSRKYGISMNYFKVKRAIQVFEELSLIKKLPYGEKGQVVILNNIGNNRTNLENSCLFRNIQMLRSV